jgi:hypothetical protein
MPVVPREHRIFRGLQLGIDRKRVNEPYCASGKNFYVNVDGPISGFGKQWRMYKELLESRGAQSLRNAAEDDMYWFSANSINDWDPLARQMVVVYRHVTRSAWWPWTRAYVGSSLYLCNKEVGIVAHNETTGVWGLLTGGNVPPDPIAVCESGGRLFILAEDRVAWSTIDDGSDAGLLPSTSTGAGFQLLSILSSNPRPVMCLPYSDGVLSYCRVGILRSELRENTPNPFRHRPLSRSHRILNPWCVVGVGEERENTPDSHIFMTERGLYKTDGRERPIIWDPVASEFFHQNVFPTIDTNLRTNMTIRLGFNFETGWLAVSVSEDSTNASYTKAYVQYMPTNEWGVYNKHHRGFGEVKVGNRFFYGVVDVQGTIWNFGTYDADRRYPIDGTNLWAFDFRKPADIPAQYAGLGAVSIMPTQVVVGTQNPQFVTVPGVYNSCIFLDVRDSPLDMPDLSGNELPVGSDPTVFPAGFGMQNRLIKLATGALPYTSIALGAEVLIGPIRFKPDEETAVDMLTQLQEAVIGMLDTGLDDTFEDYIDDYAEITVEDDWLTLAGDEDWGESAGDLTEYSVQFEGTIDGYAIWTANNISQLVIPAIAEQIGRTRHMVGTVNGHYLFIRITANNLGESFHLKHLRTSLTSAGQLF